jgi:DNA uptake protein ComE-like DNA-binding protein
MKKIFALIILLILASTLTFAAEKSDPPEMGFQCHCTDKLLDINNSTKDQLKALPGVDEAYSTKIIAGRPYTRMDQLVSKNIIPTDTYEKIKDKIVINQPKK